MDVSPPVAPPQLSPDGHWWWDGVQWTPARQGLDATGALPQQAGQPDVGRRGSGSGTPGLALATRELRTTEVSGVQTLWAPGDGMVVARLQFRIGQADERLPIRGITHLVEHLAFERLGQPTYWHNGSVSMETTAFDVAGTQGEVSEFLRAVTTGLHDPPAERIATERHLLKVESQRHGGVFAEMASIRHGAQGQGLSAYLELGLEHLESADLRSWAQRWFTAENAVLWMWGGDPAGLDLQLPVGERIPLPAVDALPRPPLSWFPWGETGMALTFLSHTDRGTANAACWWLQRHLTKALRHDAGLAYSVTVDQRQLGDRRLFAVSVDGLADRSGDLRDALLRALDQLATTEVAQTDIAAWKREMNEALLSTDRGAELGRLDLAATGLLLGQTVLLPQEVVDQCAAVTAEGVGAVARSWSETCLAAVPWGIEMPNGWTAVRRCSEVSVKPERVFAPKTRALEGQRLLVAADGITAEASADLRWTVRWDDCAAVLKYADGSLTPIGSDGVAVQLLPGDWIGDQVLFGDIGRRIEPSLVVPVDSKPTEQVRIGLSGLASVSTGPLMALCAAFWLTTLVLVGLLADPESPALSVGISVALCAALSIWVSWSLVVRLRASKERRALPKEPSHVSNVLRRWLAAQGAARLRVAEVAAWTLTGLFLFLLVVQSLPLLWPAIITGLIAVRVRRERQRIEARATR